MKKICISCMNTVINDKRTLTEADILSQYGFEVIIIGLLGEKQRHYEFRGNIKIIHIPILIRWATKLWGRLFYPILNFFPSFCNRHVNLFNQKIRSLLGLLERRTRRLVLLFRIYKTMIDVNADFYHSHFPAALMFVTYLAAFIKRSQYIFDFNDIIIVEKQNIDWKPDYYEQPSLWGNELNEREAVRISSTINMIPNGVRTILDLGCGDGRLTNRLINSYEVIGIDISENALRYVNGAKIRASVESIPIREHAFDMVLSTELIEHLDEKAYLRTIEELKRVSCQYILVGVPWNEQLSIGMAKCISCKIEFHVNFHHRSFRLKTLKKLFLPEFDLIDLNTMGGERAYYNIFLLWIRRNLGGVWMRTKTTVCPSCSAHLYPGNFPERNAITKFCDLRNIQKRKKMRSEKSHVVALFRKNQL